MMQIKPVGQEIIWEKQNHIRIMKYNRPEAMNAITLGMMKLEEHYLEEFINDDDAWVLLYTGEGRSFCTGLDMKSIKEVLEAPKRPRTLTSLASCDVIKPVIAAINGYALGGGCELALACDFRIAADDARMGLPEVKRAIVPGAGGCQRLTRLVPLGNALMMLFTGDWIDAQEAYRLGLVQKVVPREQLVEEAMKLAEKICENGPIAVRTAKEQALRGLEMPLSEALSQVKLFSLWNRQNARNDIDEGIKSFMEKRKPNYKGL